MKKDKKSLLLGLLVLIALPSLAFGNDEFVVPFFDMLVKWMEGNVGMLIALIIMILSVIAGAFGGGFGVIGKGFVLSIIVGGVVWFAESGFNIGTSFSTTTP
jgi:type IV secretory pathway VirB2 component (pilin)